MRFKNVIFCLLLFSSSFVFGTDLFDGDFIKKLWLNYEFYPANKGRVSLLDKSDGVFTYKLKTEDSSQYILGLDVVSDVVKAKISLQQGEFDSIKFNWSSVDYVNDSLFLLQGKGVSVFRHSKKYVAAYVYNGELRYVSRRRVSNVSVSPKGRYLTFVQDENLFVKDVASGVLTQLTTSGKAGNVLNGHTDWVHEEEFGFTQAHYWSLDESKISYLSYDESEVESFPIQEMKDSLYTKMTALKYPKAGRDNAKVTLLEYDFSTGNTALIYDASSQDEYLPWVEYTEGNKLSFLLLDRSQQELRLMLRDSDSLRLLYQEKDARYVENPIYLKVHQDRIVFTSEKSGFRHIYSLDLNLEEGIAQHTSGQWEVRTVDFVSKGCKDFYYTSSQYGESNAVLCKKDSRDSVVMLSPKIGYASVVFSSLGKHYWINYSTSETPPLEQVCNNKGVVLKSLSNAENVKLNLEKNSECLVYKESFNVLGKDGSVMSGWIMKPKKVRKKDKLPVLLYVYGGPGSQVVLNRWDTFNFWWYNYLVSKGYVVVAVDGRGTGGKGVEFKKQIYGQLGELESVDQLAVVDYLSTLSFVDVNRIGIWGWSYGGYLSLLTAAKSNAKIKTVVAVAPVTHWGFYDSIYTERYLGDPDKNKEGYEKNSPINLVSTFESRLLLIHGMSDDNVHVQNSLVLSDRLVKEGVQFDSFYYTDKNHSIAGGSTRYHLFTLITSYLLNNL